MHYTTKLNRTYEHNTNKNFLDLTTTHKQTNLESDIYRKPTTADTTIRFLSNHPIEHKMAAFRYHISRMYSLPLAPEKQQKNGNTTNSQKQQFPTNYSTETKKNKYNENRPLSNRIKHPQKKTWTTFTYYSPKVRKISNLLKHTDIGVAFSNTNTLHQLIEPKIINQTTERDKSGVYELNT